MTYRIFLSSVQREFAKERKALAEYVRKDMLLGMFFEVFLFERTAAQNRSAQGVYLGEVRDSDIYLGLFGNEYGSEDADGVSPTEREAIVNAVCHRDYTDEGSVQVMLFRDRLEVLNPGTLPRGWTAANLLQTHDSKPHNGILATAMQWAGYVEKSGYGTEDIVRKCRAWGLQEPEYHPSSVDFRLVLWRQNPNAVVDFTQGEEVGEVEAAKGVESDTNFPVKSRVSANESRLHPEGVEWVKSASEVGGLLQEKILLFVAASPKKSSEITAYLGVSRVYGNLARCLNALLEDKLIELTIPEKPKSRFQKYRITKKGRGFAKLLAGNHQEPTP